MNNKKMTLEDRLIIECYNEASFSIKNIVEKIGFSYVAIAEEIKRHSIIMPSKEINHCYGRLCKNCFNCDYHKRKHKCPKNYADFKLISCSKLNKSPFVVMAALILIRVFWKEKYIVQSTQIMFLNTIEKLRIKDH